LRVVCCHSAEATWTWQCVRLNVGTGDAETVDKQLEGDGDGDLQPDDKADVDAAALKGLAFPPLQGSTLRLRTAGMYELRVYCDDELLPNAAGHAATPTVVLVQPAALSVSASTLCGSGLQCAPG
jgi:hypothetical protein